jgi:tetratricopeptide (TPR) repeat protein
MRKACVALATLILLAVGAGLHAQQNQNTSIRGRIFLPDGAPLGEIIPIVLASEDARFIPETYYTDSKGWFFLRGMRLNQRYSVIVESDGKSWATTTETFFVNDRNTVFLNINLRPLVTMETVSKAGTVSVQQLQYKPRADAKRAYDEGLKAWSDRNVDLARQKFREAVELDPGYVAAYNDQAAVEINQKRYAEAEPLLRAALERDAEAPLSLLNLGIVLDHLGRYDEAVPVLRKSLQLRPHWVPTKVYLGIALVETNEFVEAESFLLRGVKATGREEALAFLYLGKLYAMKGDREKAVSAWQNYLDRDPDSPNATEVRAVMVRLRPPAPRP